MIQGCRPSIKTARVRRIAESQKAAIEVMAELVAKRAEKCAVRSHLFADGGSRPDADHLRSRVVVAKKFHGPAAFPNAQRAGGENADVGPRNSVEIRRDSKKITAGVRDIQLRINKET
jgi:hypothetical protein